MAERKTIQDRIRESDLSAFSSIGSPLPGTGVRYDMNNQSTLTPAQTAYLASVFAPGAGITDATGNFPEFPGPDVALVDAFSGDPMPSMAENIAAGGIDRYLFAPLQGLGVLGDAAYGIPFAGPVIAGGLKAPAALATLAGGIAKASKGSKAVDKGLGSLDQPKDMMFIHNTSEEAIKSFDQMGGIPSPSLAVQPADVPLKGFGEIQLIAKPKNFDPAADPRNAVYSADAYTPRAPKKIRLAKEGASARFMKDYKEEVDALTRSNNVFEGTLERIAGYMDDLQNPTSPRTTEIAEDDIDRFFRSQAPQMKFAKEKELKTNLPGSVDWRRVNTSGKEYKNWLAKEKDKYFKREGVLLEGQDALDFSTTIKPYTLENATQNMIKETQRGGEAGIGSFGDNRLRALMSEKMTDLEDIKGQRSRIENNPFGSDLEGDVYDILESSTDATVDYVDANSVIEDVGRALEDGSSIEGAVKSSLIFGDIFPEKKLLDDLINAFKKNAARNVEYLEAKPLRAVTFDEFAGAIVPPKTSQEIIDILENRGLKVIKNDPETDFMKTKARQQFKDQMFSFAPIVGAGGIAALSIEDNVDDEDKGIGSLSD